MNTSKHFATFEQTCRDGVALLERGLFYSDIEGMEGNASAIANNCERATSEEIVIISGTITISP